MQCERMLRILIYLSYLCGVHLGIVLINVRTLVVSEGHICERPFVFFASGLNNRPTGDRRQRSSADQK